MANSKKTNLGFFPLVSSNIQKASVSNRVYGLLHFKLSFREGKHSLVPERRAFSRYKASTPSDKATVIKMY